MHRDLTQLPLFDTPAAPTASVLGLQLIDDFITPEDEAALLTTVDAQPWRHDLKRRVQHYGYRYDYTARKATRDSYLGPLPDFLRTLADRLCHDKIFSSPPDQVIVNEYLPGQGISAHVDCIPCFGPVIASLSLGSACIMQFARKGEKVDMVLYRRSLAVLSGPARFEWDHAIPARLNDTTAGVKIPRIRRVSLTFRTMVFS